MCFVLVLRFINWLHTTKILTFDVWILSLLIQYFNQTSLLHCSCFVWWHKFIFIISLLIVFINQKLSHNILTDVRFSLNYSQFSVSKKLVMCFMHNIINSTILYVLSQIKIKYTKIKFCLVTCKTNDNNDVLRIQI